MALEIGQQAPPFTAIDEQSNEVSLESLYGSRGVILVFYPRNNTPVCTLQLCEMRNWHERLVEAGWNVAAVNSGSRSSHIKFHDRLKLPFPIIVDEGSQIAVSYGARWLGIFPRRMVVAISPDGVVRYVQNGKPAPQTILKRLNDL